MSGLSYVPVFLLAVSPQLVLYSRHAVNELFIGTAAVLIMLLSRSPTRPRALAVGSICAACFMSKIIAAFLVAPALLYLLSNRTHGRRIGYVACFAAGAVAVTVPLLVVHFVQRGLVLPDTTSAYNLSRFDLDQWLAIRDHTARYHAGMADWRASFFGDTSAYFAAAGNVRSAGCCGRRRRTSPRSTETFRVDSSILYGSRIRPRSSSCWCSGSWGQIGATVTFGYSS